MSVAVPLIDHIDGEARRIYLKTGVTVYHPVDDIYKEVRRLRATTEVLRNFDSFVIAGGNVKKRADGSKRTSRYAIFNHCKVVPYDGSHDLVITGEQLYTDTVFGEPIGAGAMCIDKTLLSPTTSVNIDYAPPDTEVIIVVTGSGVTEQDKTEIADAVWNDKAERDEESKGGLIDHLRHLQYSLVFNSTYVPKNGDVPDGSQHRPFNDVAELKDYAELHKIKNIFLYSEFIPPLGQSVKNFVFTGIGLQKIVLQDQDLSKSEFNHIELEGQYLGRIIAESCFLTGTNTTVNGEFGNCTFGSTFEVPDNGSALIQHSSSVANGFIKPSFSVGGVSGSARLEFADHVGGITIINCNQPTDDVKIIGNGIVELDPSCQDGDIVVIGLIAPIDNSGPNCNVQWLNVDPNKLDNIPEYVMSYVR